MGYQTGLPAALAARGLTVETVAGWETRGSSAFSPAGVVCHWTAGAATGDRPSLSVVVNGRSDLAGPLANVFLTRAGVAVVVAAGRANHAGAGGWQGLSGNSKVFGIEAESTGGGDWTDAQRESYPRVVAALLDLTGTGVSTVCGHNEWAPTRKTDIQDWDMAAMRAQVTAVITDTPTVPEEDIMATAAELETIVHDQVAAVLRATEFGVSAASFGRLAFASIYPVLLGRPATPAEMEKRVKALVAGTSLSTQYSDIYKSAEAVAYRKASK